MGNTSGEREILRSPDNWIDWNLQILREAEMRGVLSILIGDEPVPQVPEAPDIRDFLPDRQPDPQTQTVASGSTPSSTPGSTPPQNVNITMLGDRRADFTFEYQRYRDAKKDYDIRSQKLLGFQEIFTTTISTAYKRLYCNPGKKINDWYDALKTSVSVSEGHAILDARSEYKQAIKPLSKAPKNWEKWIDSWERATTLAADQGVADALNANSWFEDLYSALYEVLSSWIVPYRVSHQEAIDQNTIQPGRAANDLRLEVKIRFKDRPKSTTTVSKGSFGPTFAGQAAPDNGTQSTNGSKKRNREEDGGRSKTCKACSSQYHPTSKCYYLLPGLAPDTWKPRQATQRAVDLAIQEDPSILEEVKGKKAKAASKPADMADSD